MTNTESNSSKFRVLLDAPQRIYAVGDIHGCASELEVVLEHLVAKEDLGEDDQVVFIGDYIDRGPDSRQVIDMLLGFRDSFENVVFLKGNHEDMLLSFLGYEGNMGDVYLFNGGKEFFSSYDIHASKIKDEALDLLPKLHLSFFLNLESYVGIDRFVFAHAGLDPLRPLNAQLDSDLFWIRDAFIANIHKFEKTVVFGHTPYHEVMFDLPYKIGIDTGLVYGNKLTCIELNAGRCLQVELGDRLIKEKRLSDFTIAE